MELEIEGGGSFRDQLENQYSYILYWSCVFINSSIYCWR